MPKKAIKEVDEVKKSTKTKTVKATSKTVKAATKQATTKKASTPKKETASAKKTATKKAAAPKKTAATKNTTTVKKTSTPKKETASAKKTVTKKATVAKKATTTKKTTTKKTTVTKKAATPKKETASAKKTVTKKATTKKVATPKKETVKKTTTKKVETKKADEVKPKTTVKKTAAKKTTTTKKTSTTKTAKATTKKTTTVKKASTKKESALEKYANVLEYYDLPYRYNETVVKILAQTPKVLFVYWDISDADRNFYAEKYGEYFFNDTYPVLLVHNKTLNYTDEVEINDFANSWYISIPDARSEYTVELARRFKDYAKRNPNQPHKEDLDSVISVCASNDITMPNDHVLLDELKPQVKYRNVKTGEESYKNVKNILADKKLVDFYNLYKELYQVEDIRTFFNLDNPSSGNPSSGNPTSTFK